MAKRINFSLTQIEYALAVARHRNFSAAAKECLITQPTLSMQLQKLEEEMGAVIFDRTKKPIVLTEKGAELIEQMRAVLSESHRLEEIVAGSGKEAVGELVVGIIPTLAPYLLPRLLPILEKNYPGLKLKILELQTQRIVQALADDQVDVGILATPLQQPGVHEQALYFEKFALLCHAGHPLSKQGRVNYDDLDAKDVWLLEEGHCLRHQILDICSIRRRKAPKRQFEFESGSLETLKNLVSAYGGYTLLPAMATEHLPPNVKLIPFAEPSPAREIGLVRGRLHRKKALQEALSASILQAIPSSVARVKRDRVDIKGAS